MANAASSAIPLPTSEGAAQPGADGKPALSFSPSTRFDAAALQDSDEGGSDPDDLGPGQLDSVRERMYRDKARDAIRKEQVHMEGFLYKKAGSGASKALLVYRRSSEEKLKRIVRADEIVDVRHVSRRNHSFVFEIETPERSFFFEASSDQELATWLSRLREVVAAVNASSDSASNRRRSSDSRRTTAPRSSTATEPFHSLPAGSRRSQDPAPPVHALFGDPDAAPACDAAPRGTALGLHIEIQPPHAAAVHFTDEAATALPDGINPGHEPQPLLVDEDDEEPNFNVAQRREIEDRLDQDRVVLRGYLLKQDKLRQWRRRWFVLRQNSLSYYHDDKENGVKQILRHHDIYDVRAPDPSTAKAKSLHRTYFKLVTGKRNYWLAHDDTAKAREWFNALRSWTEVATETKPPQALARSAPARTGLTVPPPPPPQHPSNVQGHRVFSPATSPACHSGSPVPITHHASSHALGPSQ
ncbi:hypothetical protein GGF46_001970 [Coemansia sp. RSA 552]|nr:hypothetical protein GGF46_001970 [Coemansia sp. RSA 552]